MTWVKVDDQFPTHPKIIAAGGDAAWLNVCALCYCAQHLTDGLVPRLMLERISDRRNVKRLTERLIEVGIWIDQGDMIEIHGYLDYNPSRVQVLEEREARSIAGAMGAAKRWHGKSHSTPQSDRIDNADAPVPVPSRPSDQELSREFVHWWSHYPRKIDKTAAEKTYRAKRRGGADPDSLLAAVKNYAQSVVGTEPSYIKHARTFLNNSWSEWVDGHPSPSPVASMDEITSPDFTPRLVGPYVCPLGLGCDNGNVPDTSPVVRCACMSKVSP